jgi:hypothetical protein
LQSAGWVTPLTFLGQKSDNLEPFLIASDLSFSSDVYGTLGLDAGAVAAETNYRVVVGSVRIDSRV